MSIKANELRLGNYVYHNNTFCNPYMKLEADLWRLEINEKEETFPQFDPIPLTPEILEKCGWQRNEYDANKRNKVIKEMLPEIYANNYKDFSIQITEDGWQLSIEETDEWDVWYGKEESWDEKLPLVSIKYLHQLQNLCHALTGTDMEIKI